MYRAIISGGGTGGHIFPALSIAGALREKHPDMEILFVGALGRMEMKRVPEAGYEIVGLPISGFIRRGTLKNFKVLGQLVKSVRMARSIVREFKPDVVVGVGGYASAPVLRAASSMGIPTLLQEQNSYAGMTNKWLSRKADRICVAYSGMGKFFPEDKIVVTGNPVRGQIENMNITREEACEFLGLDPSRKIVLAVGGSLGARTVNESMKKVCDSKKDDTQILWQTGEYYYKQIKETSYSGMEDVYVMDFIKRMDMAYAAADVIISRAGAGTISELCLVGKPCILIPSPNVAEDHQTHNAMALVSNGAAILVPDRDAATRLPEELGTLLEDSARREEMAANIRKMAFRNSAGVIADYVLELINSKQ